jgi:hypothetical protein
MNKKYSNIFFLIALFGCASLSQAQDISTLQTNAESIPNSADGIKHKKISDIDQRFNPAKNPKTEDIAQAIAEVDEWSYAPEDVEQAEKKIDNEIEKLRVRIETEVGALSKAAIDAPNGRVASEKMSKINASLSLYPAPKTDAERTQLEKLTSSILDTSRRVEDIRRLRYNSWAIGRIQGSLAYYRYEIKLKVGDITQIKTMSDLSEFKRTIQIKADKNALTKACIDWMSSINPAFLEPVVMELYNYAFGLTRDVMGGADDFLIVLTQGFANPTTKRLTPSDF